jgi:hypothetical protein
MPTSVDGLTISTDPAEPAPGQSISVSIESYSTDLNAASIVWLVDGKNYAQGIGKTSVNVTAPVIGKTMKVTVAVKTVEGREVKKEITVAPGGVDLIWESAGFAPPFYKGKTLFVYQNLIRVNAIPHLADAKGNEIDPGTLLYKWTENDKVIQDQSGYGKQTLLLQENLPRPFDVQLQVSTPTGSAKASAAMTLTPGDPSISFYEDDPLYGALYNKSLTSKIHLTNSEISIRAVPFSFNVSKNAPLTYNWSVNNLERNDLSKNELITLRTKGDVEGTSAISLDIRGGNDILQAADNSVSIQFTKRQAVGNSTLFQ